MHVLSLLRKLLLSQYKSVTRISTSKMVLEPVTQEFTLVEVYNLGLYAWARLCWKSCNEIRICKLIAKAYYIGIKVRLLLISHSMC